MCSDPTRTNIKTGPLFQKQGCHSASAFHETPAVCFSVNGPKLWNILPDKIRSINDYRKFKRNLKTWLFDMF